MRREQGESVVLASVVRTEGATYRAVGARMVVRADGATVGLLSSGCLEGEIIERAARVRESGIAEVMTYDGRSDEELVWGLGTGCNGLVEILLERRTAESAGVLGALLARALDDSQPSVIATVVRASGAGAPRVGARVLVALGRRRRARRRLGRERDVRRGRFGCVECAGECAPRDDARVRARA